MLHRRNVLGSLAAAALALSAGVAEAQEVTLRLHQFLPEQANVPAHIFKPWIEQVEAASDGRIKIEMFSAMALGGTPPQLIDQARDGVVDIVWTLPGYTPGRFPRTEVFELPFMMTNAEAASRAYWQLFESDMKDADFKDLHILGAWVHGPGVIHTKDKAITHVADAAGLNLRGPTRVINDLLTQVGANPVGMPVPAVPEALSKGVIDGTVIPWEVTPALKLAELVKHHTEFVGGTALYTSTFVLAMNKAKYESMPDDLRAILDAQTGLEFSAFAGRTMQEYDAPARQIAVDAGNEIITLDAAAAEEWKAAAAPVVDKWLGEMEAAGIDGADLLERAKTAIAANTH